VLAFATLGDATRNRNSPLLCHAAQGGQGKYCFVSLSLALSCILHQWKHSFNEVTQLGNNIFHNKIKSYEILLFMAGYQTWDLLGFHFFSLPLPLSHSISTSNHRYFYYRPLITKKVFKNLINYSDNYQLISQNF
jgi:hypothetical protein